MPKHIGIGIGYGLVPSRSKALWKTPSRATVRAMSIKIHLYDVIASSFPETNMSVLLPVVLLQDILLFP